MKTLLQTHSRKLASAAIAAAMLLPLTDVQAEVVYSNGFDGLPTGLVSDSQIKTNWSTRYAKGPDEGRVEIVTDSQSGKAARVKYPAFGNQSTPSGATWETDINVSSDELYMAYWVKFDSNFQFVKGGKLPGLAGSTSFPYGDNEFTTRLMWRENGKLEFYLHDYKLDNNAGEEPYRVFWDDFGEHARIIPGQWHHIEIRQKLNSPGQLNGRLQGWLDGVLMCDDTSNSGVRDFGQNNTKINQLYFSTFFGGSSTPEIQWQPINDVYVTFDDFTVSTQRIGSSGFPGDSGGGDTGGGDTGGGDTGGGDTGGGDTGSCQSLTVGNTKHEINIANSNCIQFNGNVSGRTIAVWDSDVNKSCDFRGSVSSINGSGTLNVPDNYEASNSLSGTQFRINNASGNSCKALKIRAL